MFGKVQQFAHTGARAIKSGLARAHGIVMHGMHLAGKVNDIYQVGKRVADIALPHLEQHIPGRGIEQAGARAIQHMDHARGQAMHRFSDIQDQLEDHGRVFARIRDAVPGAREYTG